MEAYKQLLGQFHSQQVSIIQQDSHLKYIQLLNHVKRKKQENLSQKNKFCFQSKRLKQTNEDIFKASCLQKSVQISKIEYINDTLEQKRSLIELQQKSLLQQVDQLKQGILKLKYEKNLIQNEIKLIDQKQIQISNASFQSKKHLQEIRILIKDQRQVNDGDFINYDIKLSQMTQKLSKVNQQNILNAKYFKQNTKKCTQNHNNSLLGSILTWQKEQSKIKKMPKKHYMKCQIQSILRALFLIIKLSDLNYGNIIEHLIQLADQKRQNCPRSTKVFLNETGQEIQIKQLIQNLEKQILTVHQTRFLSKTKIFQFYKHKGIEISSNLQGNLSNETNSMILKIVQHFQKLTSWFSRIQKRNIQLSQYFRSLQKVDQQLSGQIKSIQLSAAQKNINYLQSRQLQIHFLHEKLSSSCKIIFQFNINVYDLVRRFQNLNKFFDKIVKSTNRRTYKRTFIQMEEDTNFLKKITKILFKSPECIILDWNNVIKGSRTSVLLNEPEYLQRIKENQNYLQTVMNNDLLRTYAEPSMFDLKKSYLQNIESTFNYVIDQESIIIQRLADILKDLLLFSKNGINEFQRTQNFIKQQKRKSAILKDKETQEKLDPLIRIFKLNDCKLDKFFSKDQIKQEPNQKLESNQQRNFCIQSNDYYRRDNFKLIQKLQKIDLKRRGLITCLPFKINTSLQLQPLQTTLANGYSFDKQTSRLGSTRNSYRKRQPRLSHQLLSNRHNIISEKRQKQNSRKKDLKNLLKNISNIASQNQKYRIRKKLNSQEKQFCTTTPKFF